jgi:hypothetical protein
LAHGEVYQDQGEQVGGLSVVESEPEFIKVAVQVLRAYLMVLVYHATL